MKTKNYILFLFLFLPLLQSNAQTVAVRGKQLFVNEQRYRIKAVDYNRGTGDTGNYTQDIALMKEAGINTIRTYAPITNVAELNAFAANGIRIIMHLNENDFENYINTYKNHQAILMWEFGNEFNYHPEWFGGNINVWYSKLQACAIRAHQLDVNHPVTTAHGEVPTASVLSACPAVDVWGLNLYRWDNDVPAIDDFRRLSQKAMYVSECGADSYNKLTNTIREDLQMQANKNILTGIFNRFDDCIGAAVFEFCDEWWKAGSPDVQNPGGSAPNSSGVPYDGSADEEYWGIVRRDRSKKPSFFNLKEIYTSLDAFNKKIEAESYSSMSGVQTETCTEGGLNVGYIDTNDWMAYNSITFPTTGVYTFEFRVASYSGGKLSVDLNAGSIVVGSVTIPATGGWQNWTTVSFTKQVNAGTYNLGIFAAIGGWNINYLVIKSGGQTLRQGVENEKKTTDSVTDEVQDFSIFPIPVNEKMNVHFGKNTNNLGVQVLNMSGISVLKTDVLNDSAIDVSALTPGLYLIKVSNGKQEIVKTFIKK